jgi:hypothetical protein
MEIHSTDDVQTIEAVFGCGFVEQPGIFGAGTSGQ